MTPGGATGTNIVIDALEKCNCHRSAVNALDVLQYIKPEAKCTFTEASK